MILYTLIMYLIRHDVQYTCKNYFISYFLVLKSPKKFNNNRVCIIMPMPTFTSKFSCLSHHPCYGKPCSKIVYVSLSSLSLSLSLKTKN